MTPARLYLYQLLRIKKSGRPYSNGRKILPAADFDKMIREAARVVYTNQIKSLDAGHHNLMASIPMQRRAYGWSYAEILRKMVLTPSVNPDGGKRKHALRLLRKHYPKVWEGLEPHQKYDPKELRILRARLERLSDEGVFVTNKPVVQRWRDTMVDIRFETGTEVHPCLDLRYFTFEGHLIKKEDVVWRRKP